MKETTSAARWRTYITIFLTLIILPFGALGFGSKLVEFFHIVQSRQTDSALAVAPILNYLLASAGFFLILVWAILNGMFHDVEGPKYTMLEIEGQLDREESSQS